MSALDPISTGLRSNSVREQQNPTIEEITRYYLETRRTDVKRTTYKSYCAQSLPYIVGPLPTGAKGDRCKFTRTGKCPEGQQLLQMLGPLPLSDLSTAMIRQWHRVLADHVSNSTARIAKKHLRAALSLAAEDFGVHIPAMPRHRGRGVTRPKKTILAGHADPPVTLSVYGGTRLFWTGNRTYRLHTARSETLIRQV